MMPSVVSAVLAIVGTAAGAATVDERVMVFVGSATPLVDAKFVRVRVRVVPWYNGFVNVQVMELEGSLTTKVRA